MSSKYPQPWFRPSRGLWFVTLNGRQVKLGADKAEAFRRYHELMADPDGASALNLERVVELFDAFLEWCSHNRKQRT